jgi:ketosteroid isomerase-like protein
MNAATAVRKVIEEYVSACRAGDVKRLQAIFHPDALMSGFLAGQWLMGSTQPFWDAVCGAPAPDASGADYRAEIVSVDVTGDVASAVLKEWGYLGLDFTDYFHLAKTDAGWKIISKTFTSR